jgi:hypothetical protein
MATTAKPAAAKKAAPTAAKPAGTPLNAKLIKRLKDEANIDVTTEEEALEKITAILAENEIVDLENYGLADLVDMVSAFPQTNGEEEAEEVAPKKPTAKKGTVKKAPEPEEEEETTEEATEEEEEVVAPPKKVSKTKAKQHVEEETEELVEEVETKGLTTGSKKGAKKSSPKKESTRVRKLQGRHWETLTDAEKSEAVKPLKKYLPEKSFRIVFLQRSFIVKYLGKTSEHNIFKLHLLRLLDDGKLEGIFVTHRFKTPAEFMEYLPEDLGNMKLNKGASCSYIHPFHLDQVIELLKDTDFLKESIARAQKQDVKMADNLKKLNTQIESKGTTKGTPVSTVKGKKAPKVVEVEAEEEEAVEEEIAEEEEEETPPPPKVASKKPAPAAAKAPAAPAKKAATPAPIAKATPVKKK